MKLAFCFNENGPLSWKPKVQRKLLGGLLVLGGCVGGDGQVLPHQI